MTYMEEQLTMATPIPAKRPKPMDRWVTLATAAELAKRLTRHDAESLPESESAKVAAQIADVLGLGDGYEIAKALEDGHGWSPNMEIAEILDHATSIRYGLVEKAEEEWFSARKPALLPVGTRVAFDTYEVKTWKPIRVEGVIRSVDDKHGRYAVACPSLGHLGDEDVAAHKCGTHGSVVNYEDAEPLP